MTFSSKYHIYDISGSLQAGMSQLYTLEKNVNCLLCDISEHHSVEGWPSFFENFIRYVICAKLCGGISPKLSVWIIFHPKIKRDYILKLNEIIIKYISGPKKHFYWSKMGFLCILCKFFDMLWIIQHKHLMKKFTSL